MLRGAATLTYWRYNVLLHPLLAPLSLTSDNVLRGSGPDPWGSDSSSRIPYPWSSHGDIGPVDHQFISGKSVHILGSNVLFYFAAFLKISEQTVLLPRGQMPSIGRHRTMGWLAECWLDGMKRDEKGSVQGDKIH